MFGGGGLNIWFGAIRAVLQTFDARWSRLPSSDTILPCWDSKRSATLRDGNDCLLTSEGHNLACSIDSVMLNVHATGPEWILLRHSWAIIPCRFCNVGHLLLLKSEKNTQRNLTQRFFLPPLAPLQNSLCLRFSTFQRENTA